MTKRQKSNQLKKEKNSNAFKHQINSNLVDRIATSISQVYPEFDIKLFSQVKSTLPQLEMKSRVNEIQTALAEQLPKDFKVSSKILLQSVRLGNLNGFDLWPYTEFIQQHGLKYPSEAMQVLYQFTQRFTAEFAVRPFLVQEPNSIYKQLLNWTDDPNEHVRRWTSEGTRPRLPWGLKLKSAIKNPVMGLNILERLKYDQSIYVRKSVANHLNDISKDHPDLVIQTLKSWLKNSPREHANKIKWIQRRALRTLIKKGNKKALAIFGVLPKPKLNLSPLELNKKNFKIGDTLKFDFSVTSLGSKKQNLEIDYIINFLKSNGKLGPRIYKLKKITLNPGEKFHISKRHSLKKITTIKYYPGRHELKIQINGDVAFEKFWHLKF